MMEPQQRSSRGQIPANTAESPVYPPPPWGTFWAGVLVARFSRISETNRFTRYTNRAARPNLSTGESGWESG